MWTILALHNRKRPTDLSQMMWFPIWPRFRRLCVTVEHHISGSARGDWILTWESTLKTLAIYCRFDRLLYNVIIGYSALREFIAPYDHRRQTMLVSVNSCWWTPLHFLGTTDNPCTKMNPQPLDIDRNAFTSLPPINFMCCDRCVRLIYIRALVGAKPSFPHSYSSHYRYSLG